MTINNGASLSSPFIRIVIPAYCAVATLRKCVSSVYSSQIQYSYEIVVINDGENPNIELLSKELNFRIINSNHKGAAVARNIGVDSFLGNIIVFIDADVEINESAISELIEPIITGEANATYGRYSTNVDGLKYFQKYKQLYLSIIYNRKTGYVQNFFWTAISAIRKSDFAKLGGFKSDLPGHIGEDVELGQRITNMNMRIKNVPTADGKHLKGYTLKTVFLNDLKKGISTIYLSLLGNKKITNNPHASQLDIISVAYSFFISITAIILIISGITLRFKLLFLILLFAPYFLLRIEFIKLFSKKGFLFALLSSLLMYLLDITRIMSVLLGAVKYYNGLIIKRFIQNN